MGLLKKAAAKIKQVVKGGGYYYDMSSKEAREIQVKHDFQFAMDEKNEITQKFITLNNYYNNKHYTKQQIQELAAKNKWNFIPPVLPDPYIQVESQIDAEIPEFEFKGRDDDLDSSKAKLRELVVRYIVYVNNLKELQLDNERTLNEIGNAFWKVSFDDSIKGPGFIGDIVIGNPDPANIFPDPSAYDIDDAEWIIYAFRMHRRKARRTYGEIVDEITNDNNHADTEIYESAKRSIDDDTLQVVEYWYRDEEGDIACSVQINNVEVKHIPKYWINTRSSGNQLFPFVKYGKIPVRKSFWDKGEIESIMDLVDAADREFMNAILNDSFMGNDIILREEDALSDGEEFTNLPGQEVRVRANKINSIRRLGGLTNGAKSIPMIEFIHAKIQETNGNFDSAQGKEPVRVTTSSGIAQLNERADARKVVKKAGRLEGFVRLYQLIDWTALDFYTQDRNILIRGKKEGEQDDSFTFNSNQARVIDDQATTELDSPQYYFPRVDVEITAGEGIRHSKSFTLAATQELVNMPINPANVGIVLSIIDLLDLPNKQEVKESVKQGLAQQQPQPGQPQAQPEQQDGQLPPEIEQALSAFEPEIRQMLLQLQPEALIQFLGQPPEIQDKLLEQIMGGG